MPPAEGGGMEIYMKNSVLNIYKYLFFLIYGSMIYVYIYNLVDKGLSISNGRMNLIMLVVGIVVLGTTSKMLKLSKRTSIVYVFLFIFLIWCVIGGFFSRYENVIFDHFIFYSMFVIDIVIIGLCISRFQVIVESIVIPFCIIGYMLIERMYAYKQYINSSSMNVVSAFLRQGNYVRLPFGFEHVNSLGNICLLEICLFITLFSYLMENKEIRFSLFLKLILLIIAFLDVYVMLYTSTRTAIMCTLILFLMILVVSVYRANSTRWRILFSFLGMFCAIMLIVYMIIQGKFSLSTFDAVSGRNNSLNLKIMKDAKDLIFGIGFVNPGLFGQKALGELTTWMDNYYIYIFVTTGLVGAILNFGFIYLTGRQLFLRIIAENNRFSLCIFFMFIVNCISGFLETSVVYPQFLFSLVGFSVFWGNINESLSTQITTTLRTKTQVKFSQR